MALGRAIVARAHAAGVPRIVLAHEPGGADLRELGQRSGFQVFDLGRGRLDLVRTAATGDPLRLSPDAKRRPTPAGSGDAIELTQLVVVSTLRPTSVDTSGTVMSPTTVCRPGRRRRRRRMLRRR